MAYKTADSAHILVYGERLHSIVVHCRGDDLRPLLVAVACHGGDSACGDVKLFSVIRIIWEPQVCDDLLVPTTGHQSSEGNHIVIRERGTSHCD